MGGGWGKGRRGYVKVRRCGNETWQVIHVCVHVGKDMELNAKK